MPPLHLAFLLLVNLIWGLNFIAVEFAVRDFTPMLANTIRFSAALVLLLPWLKPAPGRMRMLLSVAFILGVFHFGAVFMGMQRSSDVATVAIASQLGPPFSTILAVFFLGETVGWRRILGIGLSFAGVMVLSFDPRVLLYIDGLLWVAAGAMGYAVSAILMRKLAGVPAFTVQAWVAAAGVLGSLSISLLVEDGQMAALANASLLAWGGVLYSGLFSSIIGHGGMTWLLARYEVSVVTPYLLTMPVFAVAAGVIVLGETLTWRMWVGAAITMAGVAIITLRNARKMEEAAT